MDRHFFVPLTCLPSLSAIWPLLARGCFHTCVYSSTHETVLERPPSQVHSHWHGLLIRGPSTVHSVHTQSNKLDFGIKWTLSTLICIRRTNSSAWMDQNGPNESLQQ